MSYSNGENPRLRFEREASATFLQQLRAHLQKSSVCAVTVDLERIDRIDPAILQLLRAAGDEAQRAGKELYVDGADPGVYKALQLAKLGPFFKRLHHATSAD